MLQRIFFVLPMVMLLAPAQAKALMMMIQEAPLQVAVTEADAVLVGTVTDPGAAPAAAEEFKPMRRRPGALGAAKDFKVTADKILLDRTKSLEQGKEITVLRGMAMQRGGANYKKGDKLVLMLRRDENKAWSPLMYSNAAVVEAEATTKAVEKALDVETWNWGKAAGGLQAVAVQRGRAMRMDGGKMALEVITGLRNTTKESIWVNGFGPDQTLDLKVTWDGTAAPVQSPEVPVDPNVSFDAASNAIEIKPGEVAWISQWGKNSSGVRFTLEPAGKTCEARAVYRSTRDAAAPGGGKLFKGRVESAVISVEAP